MKLVCVGDSFTEGLCDVPRPDGEYLGWADRVAAAMAPVEYANLAVRGKLLDQIVADQVPAALALRPDVLTFHAGGNDVLRRSTDLADLFARYDAAVQTAMAPSRTVVVFTCLTRAGGTGRLADLLAARFAAFNANVRDVAGRHGARLVDLEHIEALSDRRFWHTDRLHLNPEGHRRVAAAVLDVLDRGDGQWYRTPLPPARKRKRTAVAQDAAWVHGHLAPWVWRRVRGVSSGDGRTAKDVTLRRVG
jgi:lysophospholipase L1-like esterase